MTIGSTSGTMPMPTSNDNLKAPATPVQPIASQDNEVTEVSSADDSKGGIDIYA